MSYEGYSLNLCAFGHRVVTDDDKLLTAPICEVCGQPIVWMYEVDTTNDNGVEPVLVPFLVHGNASRFYLPSNAGQSDLSGLDHRIQPEARSVVFQDLDHPNDGPFVTERAAREMRDRIRTACGRRLLPN